jgi:hypothetical protein
MKHVVLALGLIVGLCFWGHSSRASANDFVWYDPELQALAIDTYAYGFGTTIEFDFNADHTAGGIIDSNAWEGTLGYTTFTGVYLSSGDIDHDGGGYGWANPVLGDWAPIQDYSTVLTTVLDTVPTPDGIHYFTPEWNVGAGKTVIYAQPIGVDGPVPVTEDMFAHAFVRVDAGAWYRVDEAPDPIQPLGVDVSITPRVLNQQSKDRWVAAQINLPAPYTTADLDLTSLVLSFSWKVVMEGIPPWGYSFAKTVGQSDGRGSKLIARFDRDLVLEVPVSGEVTVYAIGRLNDGTPFRGSTTLMVKP